MRRWGPLALVLTVVAGLTAVALATTSKDKGTGGATVASQVHLPPGAVSWTKAKAEHLDVKFPPTCDTKTGRIAIPFFFRTECFADVKANGGATATGVTGTTIEVVAWLPAPDDPVRALVLDRIGFKATNDQLKATYQGFVDVFNRYYETYGRKVHLDFVTASGSILDDTASRADAVKAAQQFGAFAALGGPIIGSAWTDELQARGVVCIGCPGTSGDAPTGFSLPPTTGQVRANVVAYLSKKLANKPAKFAGPDIVGKRRVFGLLSLGSSDSDQRSVDSFRGDLKKTGTDLATSVLYPLDPGRAAELATNGIAKFKAAGVTTVLVEADPILLPAFTAEATKQQWFPEWVLAGSPFIDTTAFARTFDKLQWVHAFGISYFPPQVAPEVNPPVTLYRWFRGSPPPVQGTIPLLLLYPQVALFFSGLEYAGPHLTPTTFRDGLFLAPPTPRAVSQPSVSFGTQRWKEPDYAGIDDFVELWWDESTTGPDEAGKVDKGVYRYVDGGRRHLVDEWDSSLRAFDPAGTVTVVKDLPPAERPPNYPPPK